MGNLICVAILLTIILVGCSSSGLKVGELQPVDVSLAEEIISSLNSTTLMMGSFKASLTLSVVSGGARQELRGYLRYKYPDRLRLDLLGVLNELRAVIIANGDDFLMLLTQEKEAVSDKLSDELLEKVFGIKIRVSDVRGAVLANPVFGRDIKGLKVEKKEEGEYVIRFKDRRIVEEVWVKRFDVRYVVSRWIIYDGNGEPLYDVSFSSYSLVDGLPKPHKVTVLRPKDKTRITFSVSNPQVNVDIPDSVFSVEIPPGVTVRRI